MCGFVGFTNLEKNFDTKDNFIIKSMTRSLAHRGPDEEDFYTSSHTNLGHRRLIILDAKNGKQPMSCTYNNETYTIVYNGQLYNAKDIRNKISSAKNDGISPLEFSKLFLNEHDKVISLVYEKYLKLLKENNSVDFDDLLILPLKLFNNNSGVLQKYQEKYKYVFIR